MNNLTMQEKEALSMMQKDNFKNLSKKNVMQLVTILDKVDPEVAKTIVQQFPEVAKMSVELGKGYNGLLSKGLESSEWSTKECYSTEDEIIQVAKKEIEKEGTSFEEKKYYFEKMEDAAKRKEATNSGFNLNVNQILRYGGEALLIITATTLCVLGANGKFKPKA